MAITKLVAVTIAGKIEEFENIVNKYIYKYDIHLENAFSVLGNKEKVQPFDDSVQYESVAKNAENILKLAEMKVDNGALKECDMTLDEMNEFILNLNESVSENNNRKTEITNKIQELMNAKEKINKMQNVDYDFSKLHDMKFVRYRFGHIPREGYKLLNTYLADQNIIFAKTHEDSEGVWGFYFVPRSEKNRIDDIFTSLYFEAVDIPKDIAGTPKQIVEKLDKSIEKLKKEQNTITNETREILKDSEKTLSSVYYTAQQRQKFTNVRQKAAHSKEFFYIVGWMSKKDAKSLENETNKENGTMLTYIQDPENLKDTITPPTKLKNNIVFRPFEFFVKMYGYPGYNEIDPTPLLAFTYILFFGMMFGDVGQSAVLALLGFIIYKKKKIPLANIVGIVGLSGIVFGFLYGSVFGNEEIIHGVLQPMTNITTLLIGTIAIGAVIIILGMILNIINLNRRHDYGHMWFSHNGVAGVIFYVSVIVYALSMFIDAIKVPNGLMLTLILVSLAVIFFCEPLAGLLEGKKFPKGAMFYVQQIFELVEVLLSYFSNTISFLRIGAFAIVHVGMMMAVSVLATGSPVKVIIVSIIGNILVTVLEGLVVGIQVLRLEYYEMFSRYFTGNGKPFKSLKNK